MSQVLLLHAPSDTRLPDEIAIWVQSHGLTAWRADSVGHAVEELTDFTVRTRPDVVTLAVPRVSESHDGLATIFSDPAWDYDVSVIALDCERQENDHPSIACDLEGLTSLLEQRILAASACTA